MAILYHCGCGANIRMPNSVAGRKARCKSCGAVFTVPSESQAPPPHRQSVSSSRDRSVQEASASDTGEPRDSILADLADGDVLASVAAPRSPRSRGAEIDDGLLQLKDEPDFVAPPVKPPPGVVIETDEATADEERSGVTGPRQPFWRDLLSSFFFFLEPGSLVTFVVIVMMYGWMILLSFAPLFGMAGRGVLSGYLCAFYFAVILETASGEDDLPNIWINSVFDDLFMPAMRFLGTWALVLLPAIGLVILSWGQGKNVPWNLVYVLAGVGVFLWPVVILGVAIGHSFSGLWPHTIIQTVLAAPLAYLAIWAVLLAAGGLMLLPDTAAYAAMLASLSPSMSWKLVLFVSLLNCAISAYVMILSMRVIGLYYRHFKRKFPWIAE